MFLHLKTKEAIVVDDPVLKVGWSFCLNELNLV